MCIRDRYTPQKLYYFVQHDDSSRYQKNNSLLEAFYIRQHLDLPEKVYQSWASDFAERCCIEYIALLKEGVHENKERMQQIVQYIKEYKTYGEHALSLIHIWMHKARLGSQQTI